MSLVQARPTPIAPEPDRWSLGVPPRTKESASLFEFELGPTPSAPPGFVDVVLVQGFRGLPLEVCPSRPEGVADSGLRQMPNHAKCLQGCSGENSCRPAERVVGIFVQLPDCLRRILHRRYVSP